MHKRHKGSEGAMTSMVREWLKVPPYMKGLFNDKHKDCIR
jgi:hypothetical protein